MCLLEERGGGGNEVDQKASEREEKAVEDTTQAGGLRTQLTSGAGLESEEVNKLVLSSKDGHYGSEDGGGTERRAAEAGQLCVLYPGREEGTENTAGVEESGIGLEEIIGVLGEEEEEDDDKGEEGHLEGEGGTNQGSASHLKAEGEPLPSPSPYFVGGQGDEQSKALASGLLEDTPTETRGGLHHESGALLKICERECGGGSGKPRLGSASSVSSPSPPRVDLGLGAEWLQDLEAKMGAVKAQVDLIKSPVAPPRPRRDMRAIAGVLDSREGVGHSGRGGGIRGQKLILDEEDTFGGDDGRGEEIMGSGEKNSSKADSPPQGMERIGLCDTEEAGQRGYRQMRGTEAGREAESRNIDSIFVCKQEQKKEEAVGEEEEEELGLRDPPRRGSSESGQSQKQDREAEEEESVFCQGARTPGPQQLEGAAPHAGQGLGRPSAFRFLHKSSLLSTPVNRVAAPRPTLSS
ncbi:unnamed protein product, partial [Discosporangium mesarthrocarpum]